MAKTQFMLSIEPHERDRMDALRIVMGVSRSEVGRQALTGGGLKGLERAQVMRLGRLYTLAERHGFTSWETYVRSLVRGLARAEEPPTLEVLEEQANDMNG